jgi:pimeloyl-ACP methyl ester carboxylesterase
VSGTTRARSVPRPAALLALAMLCTGAATPETAREIQELHIVVDGSTIRALCTDGRRQVVIWHGEGGSADTWRPVLERLDGAVGACAFDRRGSGASRPEPGSRGWFELVDELRRIHLALGFESDYVLVAHALGGLYARVFAADRPTDLAGLVLLDPTHEDMLDRLRTAMPAAEWEARSAIRRLPNDDGVIERAVAERARRARLPDIPTTVITPTTRTAPEGWDARFVDEAARQLQGAILRGITLARHIPAGRSGRDAQLDQPGLVAEEILRTVRASRR